jgi:formylglycine-generating enzyme required for sulfatase activity
MKTRILIVILVISLICILLVAGIAIFQSFGTQQEIAALETINAPFTGATPGTLNSRWRPQTKTFDGVDMVLVPSGCFMMGSADSQIAAMDKQFNNSPLFTDEGPQTKICFTKSFWIDKFPVSQAQFKQFKGKAEKPSFFTGDMLPVENITWIEARDYCMDNRDGRLPTEAEWEYAAPGPDGLIYPWGNTFDPTKISRSRFERQGKKGV